MVCRAVSFWPGQGWPVNLGTGVSLAPALSGIGCCTPGLPGGPCTSLGHPSSVPQCLAFVKSVMRGSREAVILAVGCCDLPLIPTPRHRLLCAGVASPKGMPMWDLSGTLPGSQVFRSGILG